VEGWLVEACVEKVRGGAARYGCMPFDRIGVGSPALRHRPAPTPSRGGLVTWSTRPLPDLLGFINRGSLWECVLDIHEWFGDGKTELLGGDPAVMASCRSAELQCCSAR